MKKGILLAALFALAAFAGGLGAYNQYVVTRFGDVRVTDIMLDGSDILDANAVTRITVGSTNAITGNATVSGTLAVTGATTLTGNLTVSGTTFATVAVSTAPRDNSSGTGITPVAQGQVAFNTTDKELCFSTGTTRFTWVRVSTPTVACAH